MNLQSFLAAVVVALSPVAATAVTINIDAGGGNTFSTDSGNFIGTVPGSNIGFNVGASGTDTLILGQLESTVIVSELSAQDTATVEIIQDYVNLKDSSLMNIGSRAEVGDIVGLETPFDPVRGSVNVAHFISFDDGTTETELFNFLFEQELTLEKEEVDKIGRLGENYQLRSLFTFVANQGGVIGVAGDILVRPAVPAPATILLMGTVWAGFGLMRRKAKKAARSLLEKSSPERRPAGRRFAFGALRSEAVSATLGGLAPRG